MVPLGTRQGPQSNQGDYFLDHFHRIALCDWVDVEEHCSQVLLVSRVSMAATGPGLYRQAPHLEKASWLGNQTKGCIAISTTPRIAIDYCG